MSGENLKHEGRIAQWRREEAAYRLRISGLVKSLRDLLDPLEPEERLEGELIASQALSLAAYHVELTSVLEGIEKAEKLLGLA